VEEEIGAAALRRRAVIQRRRRCARRREEEGRGMERRCCSSFIGRRGKGKRRSEAVAELGRCAINGGGGGSVEGSYRDGKG
jgi:hypothetical protein